MTVNTVLTTPTGLNHTRNAQPDRGSNTNHASTFPISSFGRSDSGIYVCRATVNLASINAYISDSSTVQHSVRITTGEICSMLLLSFDNHRCFFFNFFSILQVFFFH